MAETEHQKKIKAFLARSIESYLKLAADALVQAKRKRGRYATKQKWAQRWWEDHNLYLTRAEEYKARLERFERDGCLRPMDLSRW